MQNGLKQPGGEAMPANNVIDLAERRAAAASGERPKRPLDILPSPTPRTQDPFTPSVEDEVRFYWHRLQDLWAARAGDDPQALWEAVDEIEVTLIHAQSTAIRRRYEDLLKGGCGAVSRA